MDTRMIMILEKPATEVQVFKSFFDNIIRLIFAEEFKPKCETTEYIETKVRIKIVYDPTDEEEKFHKRTEQHTFTVQDDMSFVKLRNDLNKLSNKFSIPKNYERISIKAEIVFKKLEK